MFNDDLLPVSMFPIRNFDSLFDNLLANTHARTSMLFKEEDNGTAYLTIDLPGVKLEDLQVEVNGKLVTVKGERKTKTGSSSYSRSFTLHEKYDPATLAADLSDGVLTLTVSPKSADKTGVRKVMINSSNS